MAREYRFTPIQADEIEFNIIVEFLNNAKQRNESLKNEKLAEYMMLINIIHSSEPQKLYSNLKEILDGEEKESGIEALRKIKERRGKLGN